TFEQTVTFFEKILKVIHPFMPFISEELWHDEIFGIRDEMDCCIVAEYPTIGDVDKNLLNIMEGLKHVISEIRNIRNTKQISPKEALPLAFKKGAKLDYLNASEILHKLANVSSIEALKAKPENAVSFMNGTDELFVDIADNIDLV